MPKVVGDEAEEQLEAFHEPLLMFAFYPRLRFTRKDGPYRPVLPKRIHVLGQIIRGDLEWENERGRVANLDVRLMYDPVEYAHEEFRHTRWEMIRPFKENQYFKKVHKPLNSLIADLGHPRNESDP